MKSLDNPRLDPRQVSLYGNGHEREIQFAAPPTYPQWVRQEHPFGCVLASVAMVLGKSYASVHDSLAPIIWESFHDEGDAFRWRRGHDFNTHGWYFGDAYRWLEEQGYATQMRYRVRWGHVEVTPWPPASFAPIHIVEVLTKSGTQHSVVMTQGGKILDPCLEPGTWEENWDFYEAVKHVCGIWKVGVL